ncbi:MAG: YbjN domain-containing protein [Clostridia bacterium]|nr:YbjN domain-containing protein [Clostridia bacterium]
MSDFIKLFTDKLEEQEIWYTAIDKNIIKVNMSGENKKDFPVYVVFDSEGLPIVQFKCWDIVSFTGKEALGIVMCNSMNKLYRWVRFYLDDTASVIVDTDTYVEENTCGEACLNLLQKMASIIDDAYPALACAVLKK